ncbi:MAG TPA: Asp-tRNA(Asn)/Glu-tRNA(Gln) amidotransferase subunit GatB [Atribacteraceae bacterium]|nr:Asp-tRNA(Asn)/Glu-tRNA(Gln) amidotransferase subunit GatB [Atribacteraceae bacterium]
MAGYNVTIGIEVHCHLSTQAKMFCRCGTDYIGKEPNSLTCPVCLGIPGSLPVLNRKVLELALKAALALDCDILPRVVFHRKNYFYPDLPKGYQISQYDFPIGVNGIIRYEVGGLIREIRIKRVHTEEDAGKLVHQGEGFRFAQSGVDYNRSGIPLVEIVTEPDLTSPEEARECLMMLRTIVRYLEVSDGNMEEGSLRCDANISLSNTPGEMGVKVEVKNMNSFRSVYRALQFEVERQSSILRSNRPVIQETRHWDEMKNVTVAARGKEEAEDYRYFPDPDLLPMNISDALLTEIRASLTEMPLHRKERFMNDYELTGNEAEILVTNKNLADFFEECLKDFRKPRLVCNWVLTEILRYLNEEGQEINQSKLTPRMLAELLRLLEKKEISGTIAKNVLEDMFLTGSGPREIIARKGISFISNEKELEKIVREMIEKNPQSVADYLSGKEKAFNFLVGAVMKATRGQASPELVKTVLARELQAGG